MIVSQANPKPTRLFCFRPIIQGDQAAAGTLHERVVEIRERVLGPQHPTVAEALDSWAGVLGKQVRACVWWCRKRCYC